MATCSEDTTLAAAIEGCLEPARLCFKHHEEQERLGISLEKPTPSLQDLSPLIQAAIGTHPRFAKESSVFFGAKQLMRHPFYQAVNCLNVAVERGALGAVKWLHKIYSTERVGLRYAAEIYGLKLIDPIRLSNGICLMPLQNLPPSPNARASQSQFEFGPGKWPVAPGLFNALY